jgi:putative restriction endonuclease
MAKAVFTAQLGSRYDDLPEERYHFPTGLYLRQVEEALGDLILYYEPRRNRGRQAYFAVARVTAITPDAADSSHAYAQVSDYLQLEHPVPFQEGGQFYESALRSPDGGTNLGSFQRAVRLIPDPEFYAILRSGFSASPHEDAGPQQPSGLSDTADPPPTEEREILQQVVSRPFRDAAFAREVRMAYKATCGVTGLKLVNGGGRVETEAAHIRPVGDGHKGPDSVRNGVALCRTAHWMFDRGLLSIDDNYRILVAQDLVPAEFRRLINSDGLLQVPSDSRSRPHPKFLQYHRDRIFKG